MHPCINISLAVEKRTQVEKIQVLFPFCVLVEKIIFPAFA